MMYINVFDSCLTFNIPRKDNTSFIVTMKDVSANKVCNSQFIEKLLDSHAFMAGISEDNVFGFGNRNI